MCAEAVKGSLYLDDVKVGDSFRSGEHALDEQQIIDFASSFDPQRFHLSDAAARESLFKGLAASGWHTASITMRLLVESLPLADGVIGAGVELSWPRPTRPDDILHVVSTVTDIHLSQSKPDRAIATIETRTLSQNGEVLQRMLSKNVLFKRRG